jgi:hypothetical protein
MYGIQIVWKNLGKIEELKMSCLICFDYVEAIFRGCGLARLLSIFEETNQQILDHDVLVLFEQVEFDFFQKKLKDQSSEKKVANFC